MDDATRAVNDYLAFVSDPGSLVDPEEVAVAEKEFEEARTPVERLVCMSRLEKLRNPDADELRTRFVELAANWARREGIRAEAFRAMGVPDKVLADAGLTPASRRSVRPTTAPAAPSRVTTTEASEWMLSRTEPFSVNDVRDSLGGAQLTVRRAVKSLLESGLIEPVDSHQRSTRGRKSILYLPTADTVSVEEPDEEFPDQDVAVEETPARPRAATSRRGARGSVRADSMGATVKTTPVELGTDQEATLDHVLPTKTDTQRVRREVTVKSTARRAKTRRQP